MPFRAKHAQSSLTSLSSESFDEKHPLVRFQEISRAGHDPTRVLILIGWKTVVDLESTENPGTSELPTPSISSDVLRLVFVKFGRDLFFF